MKKTSLYLFIVLLLSVIIVNPVFSQSKAMNKQLKKEYKKKIKEFEKEGWKVTGSSRTLEVLLLQHYEKLNSGDYKELEAYVSNCKSMNVCKQNALNNALTYYASAAGSYVKGRITSDLQNDQTKAEGEFDKLYAAYERLVGKEIKGEVIESFSVYRDNGDTKEYRTFYLISEAEASKARLRALEQAFQETKVAQEYARKISEFVNEGFEVAKPEK
ncbi:MAG: hypothetical protein JXR60_00120 [Bacteroidales bacterium]|nr:hypothetical protein [Bacteroidales bacterium]